MDREAAKAAFVAGDYASAAAIYRALLEKAEPAVFDLLSDAEERASQLRLPALPAPRAAEASALLCNLSLCRLKLRDEFGSYVAAHIAGCLDPASVKAL